MYPDRLVRYVRRRIDVFGGDVFEVLESTKKFICSGVDKDDFGFYDIYEADGYYIRSDEKMFNLQLKPANNLQDFVENYTIIKQIIETLTQKQGNSLDLNSIIISTSPSLSTKDDIIQLIDKIYHYTPELLAGYTMTINGVDNYFDVRIGFNRIDISLCSVFVGDDKISVTVAIEG